MYRFELIVLNLAGYINANCQRVGEYAKDTHGQTVKVSELGPFVLSEHEDINEAHTALLRAIEQNLSKSFVLHPVAGPSRVGTHVSL